MSSSILRSYGLRIGTISSSLALSLCLAGCPSSGTGGDNPDGSTGSDSGSGSDDGSMNGPCTPGDTGLAATQRDCRYFPSSAPWYRDVTTARPASDSAAITSWMEGASPPNGFGTGRLRIDFSIPAIEVPAGTAKRTFQTVSGYYYTPDCDNAPVPLVTGGAVEDYPNHLGYNCSGFSAGEDCHILLVSRSEKRLYEMYHSTVDTGGAFRVGCLAVWDLNMTDVNSRGQQCTSADAAGFPVAALMFTPEEVQAGSINHAVRFILPNSMIRMRKYVQPATHGTNTTGPATSGPYGFRMRLKSSFNVAALKPGAQVVARALQKYGMLMADGGNIALTAQSDVLSSVKWSDPSVNLTADDLNTLKASDFDVIEYETPTDVTYNCTRTQITN